MLKHPAPRSAKLAIHSLLVLACTFVLYPTAAMAGSAQPHASVGSSLPGGLVVVIESKPQKDAALDLRALDNPFISGVALQIR